MEKLIHYFLKNEQINYVLLLFILTVGISVYTIIPREIFPVFDLNKISISGSYSGASADNLNKIAVKDIEAEVGSINGVDEIDTTITAGNFSITLTLREDADGITLLNKVKDAIAKVESNLPSDMRTPTAVMLDRSRDLIRITLSSETLKYEDLLNAAKAIEPKLTGLANVSEVSIYGDSDEEIEISINPQKVEAYGLSVENVIAQVKNLSYIYPLGEIEAKGNFLYLSTVNGKSDKSAWEDTILKINGKVLRLREIADVSIYFPRESSLSSYNAKNSITIGLTKDENGNAIEMVSTLRKMFTSEIARQYPDINFGFINDSSVPIKNRLSTITSNLSFGLVLIFFVMWALINFKTSIVVSFGIPFAFLIGIIFVYLFGFSLNMITLIGALIVIGLAVDDAIVVSENIQRHIDEGYSPNEAAFLGAKEVFLPVLMATLTTVAAFLPLFMLTGTVGLFLKMIPVVVILVLIGSLVESFLFLPLHAKTLLKEGAKSTDWRVVTRLYEKVLHFFIHYKYVSLALFLLITPFITVMAFKELKFQFFPRFDGKYLTVSAKLDINTKLEETFKSARGVEKAILKHKDELFINSVSVIVGSRRNLSGSSESGSNVFSVSVELEEAKPDNFVNEYINPLLDFSFDFEHADKTRTKKSEQLALILRNILEEHKKNHTEFLELGVTEQRVGAVKTDIKVMLIGKDEQKLVQAIHKLEEALSKTEGVQNITDNLELGKYEYKIGVNPYGESLGLTEASIASTLSSYYLENSAAKTFNSDGVIDIVTKAENKDDFEALEEFNLPLSDGRYVRLKEVVSFEKEKTFLKIEKEDRDVVKSVTANVNKKLITATEVLTAVAPVIDEISQEVRVKIGGEQEKNREFADDMKKAVSVAMFIILILLLVIFPKILYAFMIISVIPLSVFGAFIGHILLGINLSITSFIGILGLAGVVINGGIIMLDFLQKTKTAEEFFKKASARVRPIIITTITTFIGLVTLIFYASGEAVIMQPIAVSLGFGLLWGTLLNLFYIPILFGIINNIKEK